MWGRGNNSWNFYNFLRHSFSPFQPPWGFMGIYWDHILCCPWALQKTFSNILIVFIPPVLGCSYHQSKNVEAKIVPELVIGTEWSRRSLLLEFLSEEHFWRFIPLPSISLTSGGSCDFSGAFIQPFIYSAIVYCTSALCPVLFWQWKYSCDQNR